MLAYRKAYGLDDGITQGSQHATASHETHVPKHIVAQVAVLTCSWLFFNRCDNIPYTRWADIANSMLTQIRYLLRSDSMVPVMHGAVTAASRNVIYNVQCL